MKILLFLFFFLTSSLSYAEIIATINYEKIFLNSIAYENFLKEIDSYKNNQQKILENVENELLREKEELDSSKIILSQEEFNEKLIIYEENVKDYQMKINEINNEIYNKIENAKSAINDEILIIIQQLAIDQEIDIIFDANQYVVAMKELDFTDQVIKKLNSNIKKIKFQ